MARTKLLSLLTVSVILIAVLVVAVMLVTAVTPAVAQDSSYAGGGGSMGKGAPDKGGGNRSGTGPGGEDHMAPSDIYLAVSSTGMSGSTVSVSVSGVGMAGGEEGLAATVTFGAPLTGTYNTTSDMGYISMAKALPMTIVIDTSGSVAMPAGNSSAIIGLHGVRTVAKEKGYKVSEVNSVSVFLPDGTVKYFTLEEPLKMTYSKDRKLIVIDAYPSFTRRMGQIIGHAGAASFSAAGISSMSIDSLKSAEANVQPETIGYQKPAYVAPPS